MERSELVELAARPEGLRLLDSLPPVPFRAGRAEDRLRLSARPGHSPGLVAAVLTQAKLRSKAQAKFGPFADRMLFTEAGLEQATRLPVAARHAGRFRRRASSASPTSAAASAATRWPSPRSSCEVTRGRCRRGDRCDRQLQPRTLPERHGRAGHAQRTWTCAAIDGVFLDPARRTAGHGQTEPAHRPRRLLAVARLRLRAGARALRRA